MEPLELITNQKPSKTGYERVKLQSVCNKISVGLAISVTPHLSKAGTNLIRNQNIKPNYFDRTSIVYVNDEFARSQKSKAVKAGDVISVRTGAKIGETCVVPPDFDNSLTFTTLIVRPKNGLLNSEYLSQYMNSYPGRAEVQRLLVGGGKPNLNSGDLKNYNIFLPSLKEQEKIAEILSAWDNAIALTENLISTKQKLKKGLAQKLLFGKIRVANVTEWHLRQYRRFSIPSDWKVVHISDIATDIGERNELSPNLPVLSCTKHFGLVDSLEYFGKQIFSEDTSNYKVVKKRQFAYATNHIEEGSIGYQDLYDAGLVSPMYTVFETTNSNVDDGYLFKLLKTENFRRIFEINTSASVDRRGSLRWKQFSQIQIPLPPIDEQKRINEILDVIQTEVDTLEKYRNNLQKQKRGLMQKLLTGEWRVKVEAAA